MYLKEKSRSEKWETFLGFFKGQEGLANFIDAEVAGGLQQFDEPLL